MRAAIAAVVAVLLIVAIALSVARALNADGPVPSPGAPTAAPAEGAALTR